MRDGTRWTLSTAILCVASLGVIPRIAASGLASTDGMPRGRVRSEDHVVAGLIADARERSETFRRLLMAIESTNGIVYVEPGRCGHGARACLKMWMEASGGNRYLRVLVDRQRSDSSLDLIGSIGHELQHAIEALSEAVVVNGTMLYSFFRRYAPTDNNRFETTEAINMGNAIRDELRQASDGLDR